MKDWIVSKALLWLGKRISGYKLYIGVALKCFVWATNAITTMYPDLAQAVPATTTQPIDDVADIFIGVGAAHKAQKILLATKEIAKAEESCEKAQPAGVDKVTQTLDPLK